MWETPYNISSNGTLTMKRSNMKKMSDTWLLDLHSSAITSAIIGGCGRLSKTTAKSLALELQQRNLI